MKNIAYDKKIILEDGSEYYGRGFGDSAGKVCEIVFNTSMTGYQEIISDPSYTCQAVVMTYPLIGNYGTADDDYETDFPSAGALIVREYNDIPSNFRNSATLSDVMKKYHITGVSEVDTRKLTRSIRDFGSRKALITDAGTSLDEGLKILASRDIPSDTVSMVSCRHVRYMPALPSHHGKFDASKYHVVAIDCGMKKNIVRSLNARGCDVSVVPYDTSADRIIALSPDGVFISNGPGNPSDVRTVIETVRALRGMFPIFGICLGHQLIALACGAKTYRLKFGHRGGNHPVKNLLTGKIEMTSQNHSYAVDKDSISGTDLAVTHVNLLDSTIEGLCCENDKIFSVQYHPESAPGPRDGEYLFDRFLELMKEEKSHA